MSAAKTLPANASRTAAMARAGMPLAQLIGHHVGPGVEAQRGLRYAGRPGGLPAFAVDQFAFVLRRGRGDDEIGEAVAVGRRDGDGAFGCREISGAVGVPFALGPR